MIELPGRLDELTPDQKRALLGDLLRKEADTAVALCPLSFGQQAMWYLYQLVPDSSAYNVAFTARLRSGIDSDAFHRALLGVVQRHEPLRTTFAAEDRKPVQLIHARGEIDWSVIDASGCDESTLYERVVEAYKQPFDLENGPMLRACLFSRAADDHVILLAAHHIVLDGWSLWVLLEELLALYEAECGGGPANLPAPDASFSDFVRWQSGMLDGPPGERMESYWREKLSGDLPMLDLPTDRPRPAVQSFNGATRTFTFDPELSEAVKRFAKNEHTTVYTVLLAAFQALLYRYTGQEDILVGSPMAGRSRPEFASLVGNFINMVVLRADLDGAPTAREFVGRMRETVLAALEHQDYPFPLLVNKLALKPDPSRSPIFQVIFDLQRIQRVGEITDLFVPGKQNVRVNLGNLLVEPYPMPQQEGQFDLTFQLVETSDLLLGAIKYNTDLFDDATIERMLDHYRTLIEGFVTDPERSITTLPLMPEPELHRMLVEWNASAVPHPTDICLHTLFEDQVARTPEAVAVTFEGTHITYRDLNRRANALAHQLREHEVEPGTIVGVCMERSIELVVALLGILKAGGAYVPMDPSYPRERIAFMIEDSQTPVLLTQASLADQLPDREQHVLFLESGFNGEGVEGCDHGPETDVGPEDPAYVIYTSGSTGQPNGVIVSHRAIVNHMHWFLTEFGFTDTDRMLQKTPYSFDPSVHEFYAPLLAGGRLVMARPGEHGNPAYLAQVIQEEQVTALHLVPSLLNALVNEPDFANCRSLRHVFSGGELLTRDLQERFFAVQSAALHNLYGPTEATIDASFWTCLRGSEGPDVPIGHPTDNMQLYVLDRALQPVPVGVVGELYIGGVGLADGYLGQPELTADRFIPHPFCDAPGARLYKTGDLVRYRADGALVYVGRGDYQIKLRGFRLELGEIESILRRHESVSACVVGAPEDDRGVRKLTAYIVVTEGESLTPADLRSFLRSRLPEYMVPVAYVFLDALPMTPNGKVDRKALPSPTQQRSEFGASYVAPETPTEQALAQIWIDVLGVDRISVQDNFFDLGGNSLQLIEVLAAIKHRLGVNVTPTYVQAQSLRQLAAVCDEIIARGEARKPEPVPASSTRVIGAMRRMLGAVRQGE